MASKIKSEALAEAFAEDDFDDSPPPLPRTKPREPSGGWFPRLTPTQTLIFNDARQNIVAYSGKGTGKTAAMLFKVVRHCYENRDALALIVGTSTRVATEGAGYDLVNFTLPAWRDGNRDPQTGKLLDSGIGIEFTDWKLDPVTKDRHLWIQNRFGGWSKVLLVAIQHAPQVKTKMYGIQPSLIYIEELMTCADDRYYKHTSVQLGRRRGITGPQQWMASMNPEGPSHWTYKLLYEDCVVAEKDGGLPDSRDRQVPGICRDPQWAVYFVPPEENEPNLPPGYYERLIRSYRADPIEEQRMIHGKWIDAPDGEAIYKNEFREADHIRGNVKYHRGILPIAGLPVIIGYDLGQVHTGISFLQCIETKFGPFWICFDELCFYRERVHTRRLTRGLLVKMAFWNRRMKNQFDFINITDEEAITAFKPEAGSTTARAIEDFSRELIAEYPQQFGQLKPIRMIGCPKPKDSVEARTRTVMELLQDKHLVISAICQWHRNMFLHLPRDKDNPMVPKKPNKWSHTNDSMSYPMYYRRFVRTKGFVVNRTSACSVSSSVG